MILSRPLFSFSTLSAVYSFSDGAASYVISSPSLTSLRLWTFFGSYKQLRQPRQAFVDLFPVCINIYQAGKHRHVTGMTWCLCDARGWADSLGLATDPNIWSVALKQSAENPEGPHWEGPVFVVQDGRIPVISTLLGRSYISIGKYSFLDLTHFRKP